MLKPVFLFLSVLLTLLFKVECVQHISQFKPISKLNKFTTSCSNANIATIEISNQCNIQAYLCEQQITVVINDKSYGKAQMVGENNYEKMFLLTDSQVCHKKSISLSFGRQLNHSFIKIESNTPQIGLKTSKSERKQEINFEENSYKDTPQQQQQEKAQRLAEGFAYALLIVSGVVIIWEIIFFIKLYLKKRRSQVADGSMVSQTKQSRYTKYKSTIQ